MAGHAREGLKVKTREEEFTRAKAQSPEKTGRTKDLFLDDSWRGRCTLYLERKGLASRHSKGGQTEDGSRARGWGNMSPIFWWVN